MGLEGAVKLGYRNELAAEQDPDKRKQLFDEMVARMYHARQGGQHRLAFRDRRRYRSARFAALDHGGLRSAPPPRRAPARSAPASIRGRARALIAVAGAMMIAGCAGSSGNSAGAIDATPVGVTSNAAVARILENSCYGCHSNGGTVPWYASIDPSYLLSDSARAKMNFSDWNNYDQSTRAQARSLAASVVVAGEMPPRNFMLLHPSARLTDSDEPAIAQWAAATPALPAH